VKEGVAARGSFKGHSKVFFMLALNGNCRNMDSGLQAN
jgi:hypothetical protein